MHRLGRDNDELSLGLLTDPIEGKDSGEGLGSSEGGTIEVVTERPTATPLTPRIGLKHVDRKCMRSGIETSIIPILGLVFDLPLPSSLEEEGKEDFDDDRSEE